MQNVLILNDDGAEGYGLKVLRDSAMAKWPRAHITTIVPKNNHSGSGTSLTPFLKKGVKVTKHTKEKRFFIVNGTPMDCLLHAFTKAEQYLQPGTRWDLILGGVNFNANLGAAVLCSGTVAPLIYASRVFDTTGWAFSQEVEASLAAKKTLASEAEYRKVFRNAWRYLPQFFHQQELDHDPRGGQMINVNFPKGLSSQGWINCPLAAYSTYQDESLTPRIFRAQPMDIQYLEQGYVTMSPVDMVLNPPVQY